MVLNIIYSDTLSLILFPSEDPENARSFIVPCPVVGPEIFDAS